MADFNSTKRLIAKLLRELVHGRRFAEYADLRDALRRRLNRLRIRYQQADFDDAISVVESNTTCVAVSAPAPRVEPQSAPPLTRAEAAIVLQQLRQRLGNAPGPKRMPKAYPVTRQRAASRRALAFTMDEIAAAEARCDALERAVDKDELVGARQ